MPTVRTNDIETYYEQRGDGSPVVFVHGALLDHLQWQPQVEALSEEYTTVTYDVRGHGRTGGSPRGRYSIDLFADDLDALVTALGLQQPVVCGLSMGGCIAQVYASRHPDRISGLVLADTFAPERLSLSERLQRYSLKATIPPARLFGFQRVEKAMVWLRERFTEGVSGDYAKIEALRAESPTIETVEFAKIIRALTAFHRTEIDLSAISVPTLVLYGENEPAFLRAHANRFGTEIPDASVREVPGAGHASNLDAPEFFTDALRELLADVYPTESETDADTSHAAELS